MKDHLPDELLPRIEVVEKMRRMFELYGFQPLETPAMERLEVLTGKYGDEGDRLIFKVMKRGGDLKRSLDNVLSDCKQKSLTKQIGKTAADLGLRYDLTVSLARVVAQHGDKLPRPFKRYQIAPVWRADRPQRGRYREFIQCDVDIIGSDSVVADAEIITLLIDVFRDLELPEFDVLVNHRGLLKALNKACGNSPDKFTDFCTALDKLDKIGTKGVESEMRERKLSVDRLDKLWKLAEKSCYINKWNDFKNLLMEMWSFFAAGEEPEESPILSDELIKPFIQLEELFSLLINLRIQTDIVKFEPALARGLDYYTGPVFEVVCRDMSIGSLGGGGRYDELIGMFSKQSIPATGTSFGLERIVEVLLEKYLISPRRTSLNVGVIDLLNNTDSAAYCGMILKSLRKNGVSCELGYERGNKVGKQIKTADRRNIPFVLIIGDEEFDKDIIELDSEGFSAKAKVTAKRLSDSEQRTITLGEFLEWVKEANA
ncbi:histidine--tRNA ligase [bacterium]|nr:histidine--tRNA ligase [bacterium]